MRLDFDRIVKVPREADVINTKRPSQFVKIILISDKITITTPVRA